MTKNEAINAYLNGKEIVIIVNAHMAGMNAYYNPPYQINRHKITPEEAEIDRKVYRKIYGEKRTPSERNYRLKYVEAYIYDLEETYKEIDGMASMTYQLA